MFAREREEFLPRFYCKEAQSKLVKTGHGQLCPVGGKGDFSYSLAVGVFAAEQFAGLHVPQAQVLAAGGQGFAIGGKGKGQHRPPPPDTAALEAADLLARGCIPKKDSAAGQQLTVANIGAGENLAVGRT